MKILLLAPNPYYQDRGTPIDVDLVVRVLSERNDTVDVLTYHEGIDKIYPNVTIHRIKPRIPIWHVRPNFSFRKIICDIYLFFKALAMTRITRYDVLYAVEEAAFIALVLSKLRKTPFVYDMDSVLSRQMIDTFPPLLILKPFLESLERLPIKSALMVLPVCDAIEMHAKQLNAQRIYTFYDIAPEDHNADAPVSEDIRARYGIKGKMIMYVGNLAYNQGVGLLLDSFRIIMSDNIDARLVIIGGSDADIRRYKKYADKLGIADRVLLLGKRPFANVYYYLRQADILVSPRIKGNNTPMKLYTYLASGVPTIVTDIHSHTQIVDDSMAYMAKPDPQGLAAGMQALLNDERRRTTLTKNARNFIAEYHTFAAFRQRALHAFDDLERLLQAAGRQ